MITHGPVELEFEAPQIDAILAPLDRCHEPGAAVGIALRGVPVYRKAYGLAHLGTPVVLTPTTRMRVGSVSKHFTSLAYLLLCEERSATLDDTVGHYLPELHPRVRAVTVRQLMAHTSGLRDALDICLQFSGTDSRVSSHELLSLYRDSGEVNAAPDTTWSYNNGAYLILSSMLERILDQSLEEILHTRIFAPAGLHDTQLCRAQNQYFEGGAAPHLKSSAGQFRIPSMGVELAGEGGLVSSVTDLLCWLAQMNAPRVGAEASWTTLTRPQTLASGIATGYGLGLIVDQYRGLQRIHHPGGLLGYGAHALRLPQVGLEVVVLANRSDIDCTILTSRIVDRCLAGAFSVDTSKSRAAAPITGIYRSPTTGRVIELLARMNSQLAAVDGTEMLLEADEQGVLRPSGAFGHIKQAIRVRPGTGGALSLEFENYGQRDELIGEEPVGAVDPSEILGRYVSDTTQTQVVIGLSGQRIVLRSHGRFGSTTYELHPLTHRVWRARQPELDFLGGVLSWGSEGGFRFSSERTGSLTFSRMH